MSDRYVAILFEGHVEVHAAANFAGYATVCAASDNDDPECGEPAELPKRPKITCTACQQLILHCRGYTKADFSK